jgi:hypothetical protein
MSVKWVINGRQEFLSRLFIKRYRGSHLAYLA